MMKNTLTRTLTACALLAFLAMHAPPAAEGATTLKFSDFFPPGHTQSKLIQTWCKAVEARTKGRVVVEYFPSGKLTKAPQCYQGVVDGTSDLGQSLVAYTPGRFPVMDAVGLPLGYTSGKVATGVINEVYRHFKPEEFSDTVVMYLHAHGPGYLHTRGKRIRVMEDVRGLRVRSHGNSALMVKALGGVPVASTIGQVYQMAKNGEIDGAYHPFEADFGFKLGEVFEYATTASAVAYTSPFFVVMNKKSWNALPRDIQLIIREINNEWLVQHGEAWDIIDRGGMQFFLDQGNQIIGLDAREAARWKRAATPIIDDYVEDLNGKGLKGREIVDFTINALNSMK